MNVADFEDAIQAVAVKRAGAIAIITRNTRDFEGSGVTAYVPEEYLALIGSTVSE